VIAEANNLSSDEVSVGSKLIIPIAPGQSGDTVAYSHKPTRYKVRKGDTLGSIADDYEVPVDKLRKWNHLHGNTVAVGRILTIYKPLAAAGGAEVASSGDDALSSQSGKPEKTTNTAQSGSKSASSRQAATYHKVKKGETLSGIAQSYNTTVADIKKNNANLSANLRAGEVLVIRK
jgi:membrane-bound lytic murein transglycosylase D